jgi:hypothetical protein
MKPCQSSPQGSCHNEAAVTLRLDGVGDRAMCRACADWALSMGMGRELDPNAYQPQWLRDKAFRRDLASVLS